MAEEATPAERTGPLAAAGFIATAVAFGPARMGYGLFLPHFRDSFALSIEISGVIASAAFAGFLLALPLAAWITVRSGPRIPVVVGGLCAGAGTALVAAAPGAATLGIGAALAGASPGFSWSPFNAAAKRSVPAGQRSRVLSVISTGTTAGIAAAGAAALVIAYQGLAWRWAWSGFAFAALAAAAVNWRVLAAGPITRPAPAVRLYAAKRGLRHMLRADALPLLGTALSFGMVNAVYLSFAVDHITGSAGQMGLAPGMAGPVIFIVFGIAGTVGLFTGDAEKRLGLAIVLRLIFVAAGASLLLLAVLPGHWTAASASAALHGASLMAVSAVLAFGSLRLFPHAPAFGFTAVVMVMAAGNVLGPAVAGASAGQFGMESALIGAATLALLSGIVLPGSAEARIGRSG